MWFSKLLSCLVVFIIMLQNQISANEFLSPDDAFVLTVKEVTYEHVVLNWEIQPEYYLYKKQFKVVSDNDAIQLGKLLFQNKAKKKTDQYFGESEVFENNVQILLPYESVKNDIGALTITFQGCAEAGLCYPPIIKSELIEFQSNSDSLTDISTNDVNEIIPVKQSEQDRLAGVLATNSMWIVLSMFFLFGLLLAFTPCVFPMIPILSSIIVGQGENLSTKRAFSLSLIYVFAMAITYALAGVAAGLFGSNLQALFQQPWIIISFSCVFILLSLSMFGFFEIQVPNSLQSKLNDLSGSKAGGSSLGVAFMGMLSALIVGPCVAPPLVGALIYIGQTGDALLGGLALFVLSLGMGIPLLAVGTSLGKFMPKAGAWMEVTKAIFGVLLLCVAVWMISRIVPAQISMLLWAVLLIASAIYLGALDPINPDRSGWFKLWKGLGVFTLIYGVVIIVGALSGSTDLLQPLKSLSVPHASTNGESMHLEFVKIHPKDVPHALNKASENNTPVMVDLYADWCVACKEMEAFTFSDSGVIEALNGVQLLQIDVTDWTEEDQNFAKQFHLFGPPAILFYGADGEEKEQFRVVGFMNAENFKNHVMHALN